MRKITTTFILLLGLISAGYTQTVTIGDQVWSAKNLDVTTFRNGDSIPQAKTKKEWQEAGKKQQPAWCYYDYNSTNGDIYGKLYNWYAINDSRGLAPEGWHIPTQSEWAQLKENLGDNTKAGGKMKSIGTQNWEKPNAEATNESGFSGLPGGTVNSIGKFFYIGKKGYWWTSSENWKYVAKAVCLVSHDGYMYQSEYNKETGLSVRCLRD